MTAWLPIIASSAGGAVVTLLGVAAGGIIASRSQARQWIRDQQIGACAAIIEVSTQMQLALQRQRQNGRKPDWTAWNPALAGIWLAGVPEVIDAAAKMDRTFWTNGTRIKVGQMKDSDAWASARDQMESARLEFINVARHKVIRSLQPVTDPPVARRALSELIALSQPAADPTATNQAPGEVAPHQQ